MERGLIELAHLVGSGLRLLIENSRQVIPCGRVVDQGSIT